jgi:hypothetical protein
MGREEKRFSRMTSQLPASLNCPGVSVPATVNLGEHTVEIAADHSITLVDNAAYEASSNFTATETTCLNSDEVYRLLMLLHTLFV